MLTIPTSRWIVRVGVVACIAAGLPAACSSGNSSGGGPDAAGGGGQDSSLLDGPSLALDSGSGDGSSSLGQRDADAASAADGPSSDASDAGASDGNDCAVGSAGEPTDLRCTGLYSDWPSKTVSPDVTEYNPGLALWSDGAVKTRWIYLPPGATPDSGRQRIDTSDMDEWTFPVGTKLWKEFVLEGKRIETRLLWKQAVSSWYLTTYRWSPDESSATELLTGELDADGNGYEVPAQSACPFCHRGRRDDVLGFEAVSLSSATATPVTMQTLAAQGWITNVPDAGIVIPGNPADVAALGYLHANCGTTCHNSGSGLAQDTGFFMRLEVANLSTVQATDTWQTGVNVVGRYTPPGAAAPMVRLAPDDAGASCVYFRMSVRTGEDDAAAGVQMPPIDTHKVDEAGVSIVEQWINQGCK